MARYAIHVTVCALFLKLQEASVKNGSNLHPYSWLAKKFVTTRMCFIYVLYVFYTWKYKQEGNFQLYLQVLRKMIR